MTGEGEGFSESYEVESGKNHLKSLSASLSKTKKEVNEFLTVLVEKEKLNSKQSPDVKQDEEGEDELSDEDGNEEDGDEDEDEDEDGDEDKDEDGPLEAKRTKT